MAVDESLLSTFELRWTQLAEYEAIHSIGLDETITEPLAQTEKPQREAGTGHLPHISLTHPGSASVSDAERRSQRHGRPDLEIVGTLGEGGMGQVHLAHQRSLEREVAVKTLKPDSAGTEGVAGILGEAIITGLLKHPGIIPVHALGRDDQGKPLFVMKRIEGVEWRALLNDLHNPSGAATSSDDALVRHIEILMQVCNAVHFANSRGVVHRDIKPENIMVGEFGEVYLVDWGVATRPARDAPSEYIVGTPSYMAPEMVANDPVDRRTDVYLLGATLHEVVSGMPRHPGKSLRAALCSAFLSEPCVYIDSVPRELASLCNRATSRDPDQRPSSALDFRQALSDYLQHRASHKLCISAGERLDEVRESLSRQGETADASVLHGLLTECRFGLGLALREWPDNPTAHHRLQSCLEFMVELEIRGESAGAARARLKELPEERPELEGKVSALEQELKRRKEQNEELQALAHDLDSSVSLRVRIAGLIAFAGLAVAISAYAVVSQAGTGPTLRSLLAFAGVTAASIVAGVLLLRKHVFKNAFNRRITGLMLLSGAVLVANRLLALHAELDPGLVLANDMLSLATLAALAGITLQRWLWWVAGVMLLGAGACLAMPGSATALFSTAGVLSVTVAIGFWLRGHRR